jgi:hypothetical protein
MSLREGCGIITDGEERDFNHPGRPAVALAERDSARLLVGDDGAAIANRKLGLSPVTFRRR